MAMKLPSLPQSSQRTTCDRKSFLTYQNERCCETVAFRDSRSRQTARRARRRVWEGPARPVPSPGAVQDHSVPSGAVNPKESQRVKPHRPRHRGNRSVSHVKEESMNRSMPGLPVHHQLPEFTQTHVHRVGDAIQPSHPLSSPSPPAPNPSQHQSLFQ